MKNTDRLIAAVERMRGFEMPRGPLQNADLSLAQFAVLANIADMPGCKVTELADQMKLSTPTVSVAIRKLEEAGWLERKEDAQDARVTHLHLSQKAKTIKQKMERRRDKVIGRFLNRLNEDEQEQLLSLLEKASQD